MGIWRCCSGCMPMAARGMGIGAHLQLSVGTWMCCSGCMPMAARGMSECVSMLLGMDGHEAVLDWARANGCPEDM
jgi:hypothetical protein